MSKDEENAVTDSGAKSVEIKNLLEAIQDERNEAIEMPAQTEFIQTISDIYRTLDSTSTIKLNETYLDTVNKQRYRSDVIIEKNVLGTKIKLLIWLNPYNKPITESEVKSFQRHILAVKATKGIIITRGNYQKRAFDYSDDALIDLATFRSSQNRNWDDNLLVPVLLRSVWVEIELSYEMVAKGDDKNKPFSNSVLVHFNESNSGVGLISIFTDRWNNKRINPFNKNGEPEKGSFSLIEPNMKISFVRGGVKHELKRLKYDYTPIVKYNFKYLKPSEYEELKNLTRDNIIYSSYQFEPEQWLGDVQDWESVSNPNKYLQGIGISNYVKATRFLIMDIDKNLRFGPYNMKETN